MEYFMENLNKLYKKAEADETLKKALIKAQEEYAAQKAAAKKKLHTEIIGIAEANGITIAESDFVFKKAELNEAQLDAVNGGRINSNYTCYCSKGW
jgi:hypothetical protein